MRSKAVSRACFGLLRRNERAAQKGGHNHLMHRVLKEMLLRATWTTKLDQQSQDLGIPTQIGVPQIPAEFPIPQNGPLNGIGVVR